LQFVGEPEADGDADQHREARFLGDQGADRRHAHVRVALGGDPAQLALAHVAEVAALLEGDVEDALELRREVRDDVLGVAESLGIAEGLHRGVDLGGGVLALGQRGHDRRAWPWP
jgi:hypothetical protein